MTGCPPFVGKDMVPPVLHVSALHQASTLHKTMNDQVDCRKLCCLLVKVVFEGTEGSKLSERLKDHLEICFEVRSVRTSHSPSCWDLKNESSSIDDLEGEDGEGEAIRMASSAPALDWAKACEAREN